MKTEVKTVELRSLKADEGKWLTDGAVYVKTVILGAGRNESEWEEITDAERELRFDNAKEDENEQS